MEIGRQVHLLCPWARHLTGLPLPLSGRLVVTGYRWQLDSKTEKVPSLSPGWGTLANKCVPKTSYCMIQSSPIQHIAEARRTVTVRYLFDLDHQTFDYQKVNARVDFYHMTSPFLWLANVCLSLKNLNLVSNRWFFHTNIIKN